MDPASQTVPPALGEFRISAVLGHGGSGIVFDARWGPRRVALKVLHDALVGSERVRAQFLSEARVLQTITHPSVVKVLAVGELPDGRPYLAMERLEGETLAHVLARGPLPLAQALALFDELAEAVEALHAQGLVHRDLKPENVFVVASGHAVLLDFGIAKELAAPASTTTIDGGVRGTPAYMAPERFFGQPAGVATDVYELAVTLYAMLAGRLPWDDLADPEARLSPRPLVEIATVPAELDVEVRRALSTRAQNRPTSAHRLRESVRAAAGAEASSPAPADTARMRPASSAPGVQHPTATADRQPWFAERQATTDRGKTPLAWAPTEAAPPVAPASPKRRWPYVVGGIAVAIAGATVAVWRLGREPAARPAAAAAPVPLVATDALAPEHDPWGAGGAVSAARPVAREIAATGEGVSAATARAEIASALARVPADSRVLFTVNVGDLRKSPQIDQILDKIGKHPKLQLLLDAAPCIKPLLSGSEWVVFAAKTLEDDARATMIVRGRWQRADVEGCFEDDITKLAMPDGATMLQLRRVGWVDFIDEHTVYLSVREDLAAAQVHALVKGQGKGATPHARALAAKLPVDRAFGAVVDASGKLPWPSAVLPAGSDLATWFRVEETGVALEVLIDTKQEPEALKLAETFRANLDPVFRDASPKHVGRIDVTREHTAVRVHGSITPLVLGMISSAVP